MKPTTEQPADSAGELYRRTDISQEDFFQALGRVRRVAQDEIERLIEWLDSTIDVDEDSAIDDDGCDEDSDVEPSLGSFDRMSNQIRAWSQRTAAWGTETDAEEDTADEEPSLGSLDGFVGQIRWSAGNTDDREGDPGFDDREDVCEDEGAEHNGAEPEEQEPSLGWPERMNQAGDPGDPGGSDREQGIAARPPQDRTVVSPNVDGMRRLRGRMLGGYLDRLRFDKAIASLHDHGADTLCGGVLSYPGGQRAFDEMMARHSDKVVAVTIR